MISARGFKRDVVIDLVCYRRHGHNEADEPAVTQPLMYQKIRSMKTTRQKYADQLLERGLIDDHTAQSMMDQYREQMDQGKQVADVETEPRTNEYAAKWHNFDHVDEPCDLDTAVPLEKIQSLSDNSPRFPKDSSFTTGSAGSMRTGRKWLPVKSAGLGVCGNHGLRNPDRGG